MSVPMALLGLLDREPSHGYDLKRDYDTYFGRGRPLPFGQVYATLARLARDGKAVIGEAEPGTGPDRKRYTITESGRSEVEAWLGEPIHPSRLSPEVVGDARRSRAARVADRRPRRPPQAEVWFPLFGVLNVIRDFLTVHYIESKQIRDNARQGSFHVFTENLIVLVCLAFFMVLL